MTAINFYVEAFVAAKMKAAKNPSAKADKAAASAWAALAARAGSPETATFHLRAHEAAEAAKVLAAKRRQQAHSRR
jgi:hypothetical protein